MQIPEINNSNTPVLNNPYEEPKLHYARSYDGTLDYLKVNTGRAPFVPEIPPMPVAKRGN